MSLFAVERSQQRKRVQHVTLCCLDLNLADVNVHLCKNCVQKSQDLVFKWCWFVIQLSVVLKVLPGMKKIHLANKQA